MDHSCNSGSIQSSSGGDEEQNSSFLINNIPSQPQFATLFDSSQNLEPFSHSSSNPNNINLYNLDSLWSKTLVRSNPNLTHFDDNKPQFPSIDHQSGARNDPKKVTKNPKKRARASRKAPTTVLTTDVTNFRQMVQQFTGIPADPFSPMPFARRSYPPFLNNSNTSGTVIDALGTTTTNNNYRPTFSGNSMGNQILGFQTLLQSHGNQNVDGFNFHGHGGEEHVGSINGSSRFQA